MAGPTVESGNVIVFTAADQETSSAFRIRAVAWTSDQAANKDIAVDDDMLLEDGSGIRVIGKRAEAAGVGVEMSFPGDGLTVMGMKAEDLDGGYLHIYGEKL